ncbi:MAG: glycosyltransferase [bacterium]
MPKKKPYLSIIIPVYNEAKRLPRTLLALDMHLAYVPYTYELIVVNDGSVDETGTVVRSFTHLVPNLAIIEHIQRQGKGAAVKKGMLAARGAYRLFTDADNAIPIEHFTHDFLPVLTEEKEDVLVGVWPFVQKKKLMFLDICAAKCSKIAHHCVRLFALPDSTNSQSGFKCFSERAANKIFSIQKLTGWGFDTEILLLAERFGYTPREISVSCNNHEFSHVGRWDSLSIAWDAVKTKHLLQKNGYHLDKQWDTRL